MEEILCCKHCGYKLKYKGKGPKPLYCNSCSYMQNIWKTRERAKKQSERKYLECKAVRNKDGTINFEKEAKEIKHLLKWYGLR